MTAPGDRPPPASAPPMLRRAAPDEMPAVVALCGSALAWRAGEPNEALFRWKHLDNPAGPSPIWVAEQDGVLVGVRAFLRWTFTAPGVDEIPAVRAVDTATHPDHQGRGLFSQLTRHALPALRQEGTAFVFNTPNDRSRPGYLKMGWSVVGHVPVAVAVRSPAALRRLATARVAAAKWSTPTDAGRDAAEVLADTDAIDALVAAAGRPTGLATRRSTAHLRWRYAGGPVTYRAVTAPAGGAEGVALFRLRQRGDATEAVLADVVVPEGPERDRRRRALVRRVADESGADHVLAVSRRWLDGPLVAVPRLGPILTWRALGWVVPPRRRTWALVLGDVELF